MSHRAEVALMSFRDGNMVEVGEAMAQAIKQGAPWICMVVARAHPEEAFEERSGAVPALWLGKSAMFPKACKELMQALDPRAREQAVESCSRFLTEHALRAIAPCMVFQAHFPDISARRRLRREAKLAKGISKLLAAAGEEGGQRMRASASRGVEAGVARFAKANPTCGVWLSGLGWEALSERALARAERKWLGAGVSAEGQAKRPAARL